MRSTPGFRSTKAQKGSFPIGGLSIAVPGQILGLYEAKEKYGNPLVSWSSLIEPTIAMCEEGITVSRDVANALKDEKQYVLADPGMR